VQSSSAAGVLPLSPPLRQVRYRKRLRLSTLAVHAVLLLLSFLFLVPLILLVSASLSSEADISTYGFSLVPRTISTAAYQSRTDFSLRRPLSFVVFFTLLFSGGLVPLYILVTHYLQIQDTLFALILPYLVMPWYVLLLRAYFASLPRELIDAAKVDGAGEWRIFFQIVVPLSRPALATVALFTALAYWNDWYLALLFINNPSLVPLQYLLYQISTNIAILQTSSQAFGVQIPALSAQMAIAVLAIGPITLAFLAVQKHFVSGITLGGVKGD
jgi:putative aldouronate transport system permease protein